MSFQFNFSIEDPAENKTDVLENDKVQQELIQDSLVSSDNQENLLRKDKISYSSPKCAKEHSVPEDVSKILENKVIGTLPDLCPINISVVEAALPNDSPEEDMSQSISSHSDVITGVYEGGLKIWECTFDLLHYLSEAEIRFAHQSVLDLGCGAGLLGIAALKGNAENVHFQDYNSMVIEDITLPNVLINCDQDDDGDGQITEPALKRGRNEDFTHNLLSKCKFFSGEWSKFTELLLSNNSLDKYDLILTSETIYNPDYYEALHDVLSRLLKINGCVYLASKAHYFGCGGGILLFTKFIEEKNVFKSTIVKVIDKGLKRFIIKLVFK